MHLLFYFVTMLRKSWQLLCAYIYSNTNCLRVENNIEITVDIKLKTMKKNNTINQLTKKIVIALSEWLNMSKLLFGEVYTYTVLKSKVIIFVKPEVAVRLGF